MPPSDIPTLITFLPIPENPVGSELKPSKTPLFDHESIKNVPISLELSLSSDSGSTSKKRPRIAERPQERKKAKMTDLCLGLDAWSIKKTLGSSDIGHASRLIVASEDVHKHILPYWDVSVCGHLMNNGSVSVCVRDLDTESEIELRFKRWLSSGCYVLNKNWVTGFVKRRELKQGDEIGLFWDKGNSRFNFSVLKRA
ncbi:hypothetical protein SLEP1_g3131 [Rubroshorea leprosula]|uniref:TF-B3 domain-containing protein n=1 Tax=Rubroshorea leprosula TaxID=152421 RepID=A0AAV5HT40_9ROSI|nr:hypothetical protein SLEP1_g3131 [Rubroshorea leprosula]